jgi:hypothetical protein
MRQSNDPALFRSPALNRQAAQPIIMTEINDLTNLERSFLLACHEAVTRQQEIAPLLADQLAIRPDQPNGKQITKLPPEFTGLTNPRFWDTAVCGRWVISAKGQQHIA